MHRLTLYMDARFEGNLFVTGDVVCGGDVKGDCPAVANTEALRRSTHATIAISCTPSELEAYIKAQNERISVLEEVVAELKERIRASRGKDFDES